MRGENGRGKVLEISGPGTSPHAWGKQVLTVRRIKGTRNIPTCVGKTTNRSLKYQDKMEHPHMRGENPALGSLTTAPVGTSPHAWGKLGLGPSRTPCGRNIPTCVGKTSAGGGHRGDLTEHPHMRGENGRRKREEGGAPGTSPHAWGKLSRFTGRSRRRRNIPTCVGKTPEAIPGGPQTPEHPHMRGENELRGINALLSFGTSPHAWGKL